MDHQELLWRQYQLNTDLFRSYLELTLKVNLFYYAITGAILSFYFANPTESLVRYALLLPLVMSAAFTCFFIYGAFLARYTRDELFSIRDALKLKTAPEVKVLIVFLWISSVFFLLIAFSLMWLILCR